MEGLTYSPLRFVVEVGESHGGTSGDECISQMEQRLHKQSNLSHSLSHTAEGSGMVKGAPN